MKFKGICFGRIMNSRIILQRLWNDSAVNDSASRVDGSVPFREEFAGFDVELAGGGRRWSRCDWAWGGDC